MNARSGDRSVHPDIDLSSVYRDVFELSASASALFTTEGHCLLSNQAFATLTGYPAKAWNTGEINLTTLFSEADLMGDILNELLERQIIRHREINIENHEGERIPVLLSSRILEHDGQQVFEITLINISREKNVQRDLRREKARLESLIESLDAGLFLVNSRGIITELNTALADLLGVSGKALLGKGYLELIGLFIEKAVEPEVSQQAFSQGVLSIPERPTLEIALQNEETKHIELNLFPVWDDSGRPSGWGGLVQDVTQMRDQISWRLDLLSVLAHDIRAPLATLKGHSTALLANYRKWGDEMILDFISAIDHSTDQLVRQVDRSLTLTRAESGRLGLRPEAINAVELIQEAVQRVKFGLVHDRIEFDLPDAAITVRVDPMRIEEVLINLLENAARYSPEDEPILISTQVERGMLRIAITDRGTGVPIEQQERIFEKYKRADGLSEGSGLGLFIARTIVEAHGGKIWVESPPRGRTEGSSFILTVPLMPEIDLADEKSVTHRSEISQSSIQRKSGAKDFQILVVEDEADSQALLHSILTQAGYQVQVAENGPDAIDLMQHLIPDAVLLDWILPGMDGIAVCRNIRNWSNVPVLMITSRTSLEDLIAALDAGADDYITKPFQSEELLARLNAVLRRKNAWIDKPSDHVSAGGILINFDAQEVWSHGRRIDLTPTEFNLLAYLVRNEGQVLTYDQLLEHLYGSSKQYKRHDLFVHVSRLRKKIEPNPEDPRYLSTRWGVGYIFQR
jgi:PAS domain S-box-containing protein